MNGGLEVGLPESCCKSEPIPCPRRRFVQVGLLLVVRFAKFALFQMDGRRQFLKCYNPCLRVT